MTASLVVASSVDEALRELASGARLVAGGTDLVVSARQGKAPLPPRLVAIHRLEELRAVREADGVLQLGALATHAELAADNLVRERLTALADAASIVGSHATRAQGTIGGNVCNAAPSADTAPALLAFEAEAIIGGPGGRRSVSIAEVFRGPGLPLLETGEPLG